MLETKDHADVIQLMKHRVYWQFVLGKEWKVEIADSYGHCFRITHLQSGVSWIQECRGFYRRRPKEAFGADELREHVQRRYKIQIDRLVGAL